ncbi:MAG: RNA polymerase sigma factor [Leucobacter sp.]
MSTDSELIEQSMEDPARFGELFHRHAPSIHRYVARRTGGTVADDVTSETFLVAFERRSAFDLRRSDARPWLFGIATNLVHRHRIAEARTLRSAERTAAELPPQSDADELAEAAENRLEVRRLVRDLRRLSMADRDCLLLFAWEGLSYQQIAEAVEVPVGTVRSRLNRARRILRDAPPADIAVKETVHE